MKFIIWLLLASDQSATPEGSAVIFPTRESCQEHSIQLYIESPSQHFVCQPVESKVDLAKYAKRAPVAARKPPAAASKT